MMGISAVEGASQESESRRHAHGGLRTKDYMLNAAFNVFLVDKEGPGGLDD